MSVFTRHVSAVGFWETFFLHKFNQVLNNDWHTMASKNYFEFASDFDSVWAKCRKSM